MKKIIFYCQYLSGMGHLVRSSEIVQSLAKYFQVYFIIGGPQIPGFELPIQVEVIRLPALWLEQGKFTVGDSSFTVEEVKEARKNILIAECDRIKPDCLITEFFPFGRHKLLFELIPLVEHLKATSPKTKIVSSLRDVIGKESAPEEEETICNLMNQYFDLLLFHADPHFQTFSDSFARYKEIKAEIVHTGFVTQKPKITYTPFEELWGEVSLDTVKIVASIGGGRIGYEVLEILIRSSAILNQKLPHVIKIFTGSFMPVEKVKQLKKLAGDRDNIQIENYTPKLLEYMQTADISISLGGYNTTMNILSTGVRAIIVPIGHEHVDKEQLHRTRKLEQLGIVNSIHPQDLSPLFLSEKIGDCLSKKTLKNSKIFDLQGADNTAKFLKRFLNSQTVALSLV
ncbi:glycosyl transferase [Chroococcidiopsis sp. FACHB-1243]|uniref:glycosyltransferase family protein n=1 Tax=Chroococcidiopsis sp. [FACHB-1243] TaxID=2692781 RepID=UPI001782EF8C|nr:glycosyltransferase [Chroococcidiopsis sp. [FACHB-1243]]MBD2306244.1 glycosyl transferase [Chroococcidiopsis sp. [FACHB-1243]]